MGQMTTNVFTEGMIKDINDLSAAKNCMVNALNATLSTYNGNEGALQNDMGNVTITNVVEDDTITAVLPDCTIPVGIVSFGGVIYIALRYENGDCEIGSFPSPDYDNKEGSLIWQYAPLKVGYYDESKYISNDSWGDDLITSNFNFQTTAPVSMLAEQSYDGSVNLILNDGLNRPRLINTGFHVLENNTYKITSRYGKYNTNRYTLNPNDSTTFDLQTSLYKDTSEIVNFVYEGTEIGGLMKVGNYIFYAVACDRDGNETDIIAESGVIPIFLGINGDPFSISGGLENQSSDKSIKLKLEGVDNCFPYIKLLYTKATSSNNGLSITNAYRINKVYETKNTILVTGYEDISDIDVSDLNIQYFNADTAKTQELNLSMLFLGNIQENYKIEGEYEYLRQYSLQIVPQLSINKNLFTLDAKYNNGENSYYSSKFCYNYTGYHFGEIYRFGIVYIRLDNSYTDVFDVLGNLLLSEDYTVPSFYPDEYDWEMNTVDGWDGFNIKGVCRIRPEKIGDQLTDIIGIKFNMPNDALKELYKGYFFVRQKRIPTMLAQGYVTNVCENSFVPSINVNIGNDTKGYLYESFAKPILQSVDSDKLESPYTNYYPRVKGGESSAYRLRNAYYTHLFTLTDDCRAYLDKYTGDIDAVIYYWLNVINLKFDTDLWIGGTEVELYGPSDSEDDYLYMLASNGIGLAVYYDGSNDYLIDLYVFKKLKNTPSNFQNIGPTYTPVSDLKGDSGKIIKSSDPTLDGNNNVTKVYEPISIYDVDNSKMEGYSKKDFVTVNYKYRDLISMVAFYFDGYCKHCVKKDGYNVPEWVEYDGQYYELVIARSKSEDYQSNINSGFRKYFDNYLNTNKEGEEKIASFNITESNTGYDLEVPTFDGKFQYLEKISKNDYLSVPMKPMEYNSFAMFCPEYELNLPYFNNLFTGTKLAGKVITEPRYLIEGNNKRHYIYTNTEIGSTRSIDDLFTLGVPEDVSLVSINHSLSNQGEKQYVRREKSSFFSTKVGTANDIAFKYAGPEFIAYNPPNISCLNFETKNGQSYIKAHNPFKAHPKRPFNILRGIYGTYVGLYPKYMTNNVDNAVNSKRVYCADSIVNIYIPGYKESNIETYLQLRYDDGTAYNTISDRISVNNTDDVVCYRGDCFINYYTHRVNRNFNDSTVPYNDTIIDARSFASGFGGCYDADYRTFDLTKDEKSAVKFNIGDINAVELGNWVTFPVRTSMNTALRSVDNSYTSEVAIAGHGRKFYPLLLDSGGSNKMPESEAYNLGYSKSGGDREYYNTKQNIYLNNYYKNRICYSNALTIGDYPNGHRVFLASHYRDYTDLYGSIVKILNLSTDISGTSLLCVLEYGVMLLPVNERALAAEGSGGNIFINDSKVLPENPNVISDTYGSKYADSVIRTPYGVFGVDSESKKIWMTTGLNLKIISDFRILKFLNDYLDVTDLELGRVNLKTHYNPYKNDVMFTLYKDDDLIDSEIDEGIKGHALWNICYNINQLNWITFYSWMPIESSFIGNTFISIPYAEGKYTDRALYKHGFASRVPSVERIKPTYWYDDLHPFEFEFIVADTPVMHKIFDNLQIISNKAAPESFHYEIVGECFNFSADKETAYYRQEKFKALLNALNEAEGNTDTFIKAHEVDDMPIKRHPRSVVFPMYYTHKKNRNKMYDYYKQSTDMSYDYDALTGTEIINYPELNEFRLCNHVKAVDIKGDGGVLRGNMSYIEDKWRVQISPINYVEKNETWEKTPPYIFPSIYLNNTDFKFNYQWFLKYAGSSATISPINIADRQEIKIKDKYMKVKIRYSGTDLAVITAVNTLFTLSYA